MGEQLDLEGRPARLERPTYGHDATHEQAPLFTAPQTMPGQLAMPDVLPTGNTESRPTYRERRGRKAERLREWAGKREAKAADAYAQFRQATNAIPPGQPVLTDHYSARGHLAALKRADHAIAASSEHDRKARRFREKADNIEAAAKRAIYSDDENASERLRAKLAALEAQRNRIKTYNATCRRGQPDTSILSEAQRRDLATCLQTQGYQCPGGRFPAYVLTNLGGNINRCKKRLAALEGE